MSDTPGLVARYYLSQFDEDKETDKYNAVDSRKIEFILAKLLANRYWGYQNKSIYLDRNVLGLGKVLNLLTNEYEIEYFNIIVDKEDFGYVTNHYHDKKKDVDKKDSSSSENTTITKIVLCYDISYTLKVVRIYEDDKSKNVVYFYKFENKKDLLERFNIFTRMNENCIDFIYIGVPSILLANQTMLVYDINSTGHDELVNDFNKVLEKIYSIKNNHSCFSSQDLDKIYDANLPHEQRKKIDISSTFDSFCHTFENNVMIDACNDPDVDFSIARMFVYLLKDSSYLKEYWYSIKSFKNKTKEDKIKLSNQLVSIFVSDIKKLQDIIRTKDIVKYKGVKHKGPISEEYLIRNENWYKTWKLTKIACEPLLNITDQSFCVPCEEEYKTKPKDEDKKELYEILCSWKAVEKIQKLNKEKDVMFLVEALARKVVYMDKNGTIKYTIYPKCRMYNQEKILIKEEEKMKKIVKVEDTNVIKLAYYPNKVTWY